MERNSNKTILEVGHVHLCMTKGLGHLCWKIGLCQTPCLLDEILGRDREMDLSYTHFLVVAMFYVGGVKGSLQENYLKRSYKTNIADGGWGARHQSFCWSADNILSTRLNWLTLFFSLAFCHSRY